MHRASLVFSALAIFSCCWTPSASAIPQFQREFLNEYIKEHADSEYSDFIKKKVKCLSCHQGKKEKDHWHRNAYGKQLGERLDKKEDMKNKEKIVAVLKEVAALPYNPDEPDGETFGDRIAGSKLPGADSLEELKATEEDDDE